MSTSVASIQPNVGLAHNPITSSSTTSTSSIPTNVNVTSTDTDTTTTKHNKSDIDDDILHDINQDEIQHYKEMLLELGEYPNKILINTLSMIAEDYSKSYPKSCLEIYNAIKELLLNHSMKPGCKLPLVYVIDSILKNAKGLFINIMKDDFHKTKGNSNNEKNDLDQNVSNWMQDVFDFLESDEMSRDKLRKVWNTWEQFNIFPKETWNLIGQCFIEEDIKIQNAKKVADAKAKAAGIDRAPDGTLQVSKKLRRFMQTVLDEVQAETVNELDKVSLERLADINPDLLVEIKKAAEDLMVKEVNQSQQSRGLNTVLSRGGVNSGNGSVTSNGKMPLSIFTELRPPSLVKQSEEWDNLNLNYQEDTNSIIKRLSQHVRSGTGSDQHQEQQDLTTNLLGAASATVHHLTSMLDKLKTQDHKIGSGLGLGNMYLQGSKVIDKSKFTNEGLREKNDAVIARLYDGGLAFVSSSDGRRFATQLELSKHLDALFRKNQLEKSMERTDERGWYQSHMLWTGLMQTGNTVQSGYEGMDIDDIKGVSQQNNNSYDLLSMVTADESREKCVICGVNFSMKYHEDDGEFKYENCREIVVLNDDVAEEESEKMLAHATCLRGLGSPEFLTRDQVLSLS